MSDPYQSYRVEVANELDDLRMVGLSEPGDIAQVVALIELGVRLGLQAAADKVWELDYGDTRDHDGYGERNAQAIQAISPADVLRKPPADAPPMTVQRREKLHEAAQIVAEEAERRNDDPAARKP